MKIIIDLIISFLVIGLSACGGGLVTIPLIQHEMVNTRHWITISDVARLLSLAQMTPGPIAINAATFVGFQVSGIVGSIVSTIAVIFPSIIILFFITPLLKNMGLNEKASRINQGIQIGVLSLILFAVWSFGSSVINNYSDFLITFGAFLTLLLFKNRIHPVLVIIFCGIIGLIIY